MKNLVLAFRMFFRILGDATLAERAEKLLAAASLPAGARPDEAEPAPGDASKPAAPRRVETRSAALTLLATLQHEARFLDFVMESLDGYPDDQVGAAARDVQRNLSQAVTRIFAPQPLVGEGEGARVEVPRGHDPARYRLTGNVAGEPPFEGVLQHHGWQATRCEMPTWSGDPGSALVVTPAEVEI